MYLKGYSAFFNNIFPSNERKDNVQNYFAQKIIKTIDMDK